MRALLTVALVASASGTALAYPQFQLSMDANRCTSCHFSPSGGGLINGYGREQSSDAISQFSGGGGLLHGLWTPPSWLALGADLRGAGLIQDEEAKKGVEKLAFPMQADLYLRLAVGELSLNLIGGIRGTSSRKVPQTSSLLFSREHYLMWRQGPTGLYVRIGRFYAPYGLRLAEHISYVRRFLGFNVLEETYNVSAGWFADRWELHATAFTPDFWRDAVGERGSGAAIDFEHRVLERTIWGAQTRVVAGDQDTRVMAGVVGKHFIDGPRIQILAEADLVRQTFKDLDHSQWQFAGYLGGAWFPHRGWMVQLMLERWDEDLAVKGVARDSVDAAVQWFPIAHVEVSLYGRYQWIGSGGSYQPATGDAIDQPSQKLALVQIHYYL